MGALLTYALDSNNQLVHVDSVRHGGACLCRCPHCKSPLDAKNAGLVRKHHFAHAHGHYNCEGATESALHIMAKQILQEQGGIMLPESEEGNKPSGYVQIRDVEMEKMDESYRIRPDVEGVMPDWKRLLIEFMVSHKVPEKKRRTIIENGLLCIEIDLRWFELDKEILREFLTRSSDRRQWITFRKKGKSSGASNSSQHRNPVFDKAKEMVKSKFDAGILSIQSHITHRVHDERFYFFDTNEDFTYNLHEYGYDICEVDVNLRGVKSDLLLFRSQKQEKGYISINFRGRRRKRNFRIPNGLRIIDVILHDESDETLRSRFSEGLLSYNTYNVVFVGDWTFDEIDHTDILKEREEEEYEL